MRGEQLYTTKVSKEDEGFRGWLRMSSVTYTPSTSLQVESLFLRIPRTWSFGGIPFMRHRTNLMMVSGVAVRHLLCWVPGVGGTWMGVSSRSGHDVSCLGLELSDVPDFSTPDRRRCWRRWSLLCGAITSPSITRSACPPLMNPYLNYSESKDWKIESWHKAVGFHSQESSPRLPDRCRDPCWGAWGCM